MEMIRDLVQLRIIYDKEIDSVATANKQKRIIRKKTFLYRIYHEWYQLIQDFLPSIEGKILEIGSGPGFFREMVPGSITSDVFPHSDVHVVVDACLLPFKNKSLRAIVMTDVLHHLPRPRTFFSEALRCLRAGGGIIMIEPWLTSWSRIVYKQFHHEPCDPDAEDWEIGVSEEGVSANSAMPWIIFERDRSLFESEFPGLRIERVHPFMPFRYILSGGLTWKSLQPGWTFPVWRKLEDLFRPLMPKLAMFSFILIKRVGDTKNGRQA